eukprot:SAG31_NODE_2231_length_6144_cov_3.142763_4_plen_107_part_00
MEAKEAGLGGKVGVVSGLLEEGARTRARALLAKVEQLLPRGHFSVDAKVEQLLLPRGHFSVDACGAAAEAWLKSVSCRGRMAPATSSGTLPERNSTVTLARAVTMA